MVFGVGVISGVMQVMNINWNAFVHMFWLLFCFVRVFCYDFVGYNNLNARIFLASLQGWRVSGNLSTPLGEVKLLILSSDETRRSRSA